MKINKNVSLYKTRGLDSGLGLGLAFYNVMPLGGYIGLPVIRVEQQFIRMEKIG